MSIRAFGGLIPENVVRATTDAVTGAISGLSVVSNDFGIPSPNGRSYTKFNLPCNQSAGTPTDYSGNAVTSTIGLSNTVYWNWPGVFTVSPDGGDSRLLMAAASCTVNLLTDSFILGFTIVKPVTGSNDYVAGQSNLSTAYGLSVVCGTTGRFSPRMQCAAGAAFSGTAGIATVGGGFVGAKTDTTGYAVGLGTVAMSSTGKGVVTVGDIVRFGSDQQDYTISSGDADVSNGGNISFAPTLLKAIPAAATPITLVGGARVHRLMYAWDAPTSTITQFVDGVVDFAMVSDKTIAAGDVTTLGWSFGQTNLGLSFISQFSGIQFLKFPSSALPINIKEMAVQDNLKSRTGLMDVPVFL